MRRAQRAVVMAFVMLPMPNFVSRVTGTRCSRSAKPEPSDHTTSPPATTATLTPGTPFLSIISRTATRLAAMALS
jgi:hypothetical protein